MLWEGGLRIPEVVKICWEMRGKRMTRREGEHLQQHEQEMQAHLLCTLAL